MNRVFGNGGWADLRLNGKAVRRTSVADARRAAAAQPGDLAAHGQKIGPNLPLVVQLFDSDTDACWEARYQVPPDVGGNVDDQAE
jgi:hypothetical protein